MTKKDTTKTTKNTPKDYDRWTGKMPLVEIKKKGGKK